MNFCVRSLPRPPSFLKQKPGYEIYQCDWSSDVCSSDLAANQNLQRSIFNDWKPERNWRHTVRSKGSTAGRAGRIKASGNINSLLRGGADRKCKEADRIRVG